MPAQPFSAETVVVDGQATITIHGDLSGAADAELTGAYDEARAAGMSGLTIDFSRAAYINSTGIAVLVRILAAGRRDGIEVRARGLSPLHRDLRDHPHLRLHAHRARPHGHRRRAST